MITAALIKDFTRVADKPTGDAAVQPERDDVAGTVGAGARADIAETAQTHRPHGIEVADDGGGAFHLLDDVAELEAVEKLAMAEMDCTVTPGESIRLMADIMAQDKAHTDKILGRTAP